MLRITHLGIAHLIFLRYVDILLLYFTLAVTLISVPVDLGYQPTTPVSQLVHL